MQIVIVGIGKVGSQIHAFCKQANIPLKASVSPHNPLATHKSLSDLSLEATDTIIDFSSPEAALVHVQIAAKAGANYVMGTTGWEDQREVIENVVSETKIGFAFTPNYLPEVHLFWSIVESISQGLAVQSPQAYHGHVFEKRLYTKKKFSGTALHTAEILEKSEGLVFQKEQHFVSALSGHKPIDITVGFSSDHNDFSFGFESLDAERNDRIYAEMALKTAIWLQGKKGYFEMNLDTINEIKNIPLGKI